MKQILALLLSFFGVSILFAIFYSIFDKRSGADFFFQLLVLLPIFILVFLTIIPFLISHKEEKQNTKKERKKLVLICPKCNTENNTINSFCTKCHYTFTKQDKDNAKYQKIKNNDNEIENLKGKIELLIEELKKEKSIKQEKLNSEETIEELEEKLKRAKLLQELKEIDGKNDKE